MSDWTPEALCPTCGKGPFGKPVAWEGHQRSKGHPNYGGEQASIVDSDELVDLNLDYSNVHGTIRGRYFVQPACVVYVRNANRPQDAPQPVTGPCPTSRPRGWWNTCRHGGPTDNEMKQLGLDHPPAYYERAYEDRLLEDWKPGPDGTLELNEAGTKKIRVLSIKPRISGVSASIRHSSGVGPAAAEILGYLPLEEFGIAPFCEMWGCNKQHPMDDAARANGMIFRNGRFCSRIHAVLVYADEHGQILTLDSGDKGRELRRQELDAIPV